MKRFKWQVLLGLGLISLSLLLYAIHYAIFRDAHHIFIYMIGDVAFVPIEVLLVTVVIHQLLNAREKRSMLHKLNMVIGAFFSEVGTDLLKYFADFDVHFEKIRNNLIVTTDWSARDFQRTKTSLKSYDYNIASGRGDLEGLQRFLVSKRDFLLRLLENPSLLEHEAFTELLWAVFHLTEELAVRENLEKLYPADDEHLSNDIRRAYILLISEWLEYLKHLKHQYPYLFSLAIRTNPFDPKATPEITSD